MHTFQKHLRRADSGSGFVINARGEVLTNHHVTRDCEEVRVRFPFQNDQPAMRIVQDIQNDLALLRLPAPPAQWLLFRDGSDIQQGDEVITVGFPLYNPLDPGKSLSSGTKVTTGTVSALAGIGDNTGWLQVSAPIQPGNSGGPLLDMSGHVVGVIVSSFPPAWMPKGKIPQNVNFAIKASVARLFLETIGTSYDTAASTRQLSTTEISARVRQSTVLVECWK
jgi:S1-C subfamily serine protease